MTETLKGCYRDSKKRANSSPWQVSVRVIGDWFHESAVVCKRNWSWQCQDWTVTKARRPKPFQGWSFLGLEDLFAWFVSGLAIKSEPLGKLTRYIEIFFWGQKQEKSFRKLNENIFTNTKTRLHRHWSENTICYRRRSWRRLTTNSE